MVFQLVSFHHVTPPKHCMHLSCTPYIPHTPPVSFFLIWSPKNIWWGVQSLKLLVIWSSPLTCYLVPPRTKHLFQRPIFKHWQLMFTPQCEKPSLASIQNNGHDYSYVYLAVLLDGIRNSENSYMIQQIDLTWHHICVPLNRHGSIKAILSVMFMILYEGMYATASFFYEA